MPKDCPQCHLINPEEAVRCDCGYDFKAKRMLWTLLPHKRVTQGIFAGAGLLTLWIIWKIIAAMIRAASNN